jgi:AGCS family alanine or glycine:cation symporter
MYYIERGMGAKWKWLALLFALFGVVASFGIGSSVQSNSVAQALETSFGINGMVTAMLLMLTTGAVILGGIRSIAKASSVIVPFMAIFYVIGGLAIIFMHMDLVMPAVRMIFSDALTGQAVAGGALGSVIRYGVARGVFSNEAGMGSAPIAAAAARTDHPVRQALVSSTGTFWDTVVICALTGLVIVSSIIAYPDIDFSQGATLTKAAFDKIPYIGEPLLSFGLLTFTFSTILGWGYYGERAIEYLCGQRLIVAYRTMWIVATFAGSIVSLNLVWSLADLMNGLMAIPNLISLLCLSGILVSETRKYLWNNRLDEQMDET